MYLFPLTYIPPCFAKQNATALAGAEVFTSLFCEAKCDCYLLNTYLIIFVIVSLVFLEYTTSLAITGSSVIILSIPLLARFFIDVSLLAVHAYTCLPVLCMASTVLFVRNEALTLKKSTLVFS